MSLKNKTNIAFVAALLTLGIIGWLAIQGSRKTQDSDNLVSHDRDILEASELLRSDIYEAAAARRAYTLWADPKQLDDFRQAGRAAVADFEKLRKLTAGNTEEETNLAQMEQLVQSRLALLKESVELHQRIRDDQKQQDALNSQSTRLSEQITELLDVFDHGERLLLQERMAAAKVSSQRGVKINAFLGVSVFVFLIFSLGLLNRELSRREQAEHSAAEQRELLQSILDSCSDAVIVADTTGKIILRNPVGVRYNAGAPASELSAKYPELLGLYKNDCKTLFKTEELPLSLALAGGSANGLEMYVRPPSEAEPRWMLAAGGPLINNRGEKRGGVVFLRDITGRKKADEQLRVALMESEALERESRVLSELGDSLQSCLNVDEAYAMSQRSLAGILGNQPGALYILNSSRDLVESVATWNDCTTTEPVFHPDDCWALRRGQPYSGLSGPLPCAHVHFPGDAKYLCIPLAPQGETLGILYIEDRSATADSASPEAQFAQAALKRLAIAAATRVSLALANLRLREMLRSQSIRDPLTGLFNRRYMEECLNRELHRAQRTGRKLSLVMLDLDHFKHFNDTFGHQVGDILLKEVAGVIKSRVRGGDLACRFGGEEFSLIIAEIDTEGTYRCVEHIREAIKHLALHDRGQTLGTITVSAGIAVFPEHGEGQEALVRAADEALYRAKKSGRDRIVIYEPQEAGAGSIEKTI